MTEARVLAVAELEGQVCSATDCDADPTAIRVRQDPDRGIGIMWLCREHTRATHEAGIHVHLISRDCGSGTTTKCGAAATYLAVIERGDDLRVMGVCPKHIERPG